MKCKIGPKLVGPYRGVSSDTGNEEGFFALLRMTGWRVELQSYLSKRSKSEPIRKG